MFEKAKIKAKLLAKEQAMRDRIAFEKEKESRAREMEKEKIKS